MVVASPPTPSSHLPRALRVFWRLGLGLACVGCSFALDTDRVQCTETSDCTSRGSEFANTRCEENQCVRIKAPLTASPSGNDDSESDDEIDASTPDSNPDAAAPMQAESVEAIACDRNSDCDAEDICVEDVCVDPFACEIETSEGEVTVTMPVADVFGAPLAGVATKLCRNIDPECASPVSEPKSNSKGVLTMDLPVGFLGYVEFVVDGYFPQLQFLPKNPVDGAELSGASLSPTEFIYGLGLAVGAEPDPERGHLFVTLTNCYGPAEHVRIDSASADGDSIEFYVLGGVPAADLTETTQDGSAGYLNFPTGTTAITLSHSKTERELAKLSYVIRAGYLTIAQVQIDAE